MKTYKALFTADIHFSNKLPYSKVVKDGVTDRLIDQIKLFKQIYKIADKENVDDIFILGDFFDRSLVDAVTLTYATKAITSATKPLKLLAGNHDSANSKGGRFVTEAFGAMGNKNVKLLNGHYKPNDWLSFLSVPFMPIDDTNLELNKNKSYNTDLINVLLFHNSVMACDHSDWICDDGLDPIFLTERFNYVIGGHFHEHQKFGAKKNGMYCGAPMHHSFGDKGREAYIWVITFSEDGTVKRKKYKSKTPKFYVTNKLDINKNWKPGDYVRVEIKCTNAEWVELGPKAQKFCDGLEGIKAFCKQKPVYHHKNRIISESTDSKEKLSLSDAINTYVNSGDIVTDGLDIKKLKTIGKDILNEIKSKNGTL